MNSSGDSGGAVPPNKPNGLWKSFLAWVTTLWSLFKEFHLCMRVTRVHNHSDVVLLWVPHQINTSHQLGTPLNHLRREIPPGHYIDTHFGVYTPACPDLYIYVHVYRRIENGEEGNRVVLTSDQIREASKINLFLNNERKVDWKPVKRAELPKGFSCCFSAAINEVIPPSNADQSELANKKEEKKEHCVEAAEKASEDLNLREAQLFDPPVATSSQSPRGKAMTAEEVEELIQFKNSMHSSKSTQPVVMMSA